MLTGHIMFQQAGLIAVSFFIFVVTECGPSSVPPLPMLLAAGVSPPSMMFKPGTPAGHRRLRLLHRSSAAVCLVDCLSGAVSGKKESVEDLKNAPELAQYLPRRFPPRLSYDHFSLARSLALSFGIDVVPRRWRGKPTGRSISCRPVSHFAVAIFIITRGACGC